MERRFFVYKDGSRLRADGEGSLQWVGYGDVGLAHSMGRTVHQTLRFFFRHFASVDVSDSSGDYLSASSDPASIRDQSSKCSFWDIGDRVVAHFSFYGD